MLEPAASPGSHHADLIDGLFLLIQVGCVLTLLAKNVSDAIWSGRFRVRSSWSAANLCSLQTELLLREFIEHRLTLFEFTLGEVLEEGVGGGCAGIFVGVVEWHGFGVFQIRRYGQISGEKARMKLQCWFWAIIAVSTTVTVASQVSKPAFEVASIKPQRTPLPAGPDARAAAVPRLRPGGVFNPSHATIETLLMFAYDQKQYQIVGEPEWARTEAYEINARAGTVAGAAQIKLMVQSLWRTVSSC